MSSAAALLAVCVFGAGMIQACLGDLRTMTIRNQLILVLLGFYALFAPWVGLPLSEVTSSLVSACFVLLGGFALFARGWMGGGDVKLAAVTALWLGAGQTLAYLAYTALIGGVLALAILAFRQLCLPAGLRSRDWIVRLHDRKTGMPYGIALGLAALTVLPMTPWMALV